MSADVSTKYLHLTERGQAWLSQFEPIDVDAALELMGGLTLVSNTAFLRGIELLIRGFGQRVTGPVALYATRELVDRTTDWFEQAQSTVSGLDAVGRGPDLGSEARVAAVIRQIAKSEPRKFLNHPTIEQMREARCRAIACADDFIGSGERTADFIDAIWRNRTIRSWWSLRYIPIAALAYCATGAGYRRVARTRCQPDILVERHCPRFDELPWPSERLARIGAVCRKYAQRTTAGVYFPLGYDGANAAIVFEHGCPDNVPPIVWDDGPAPDNWRSLFPKRTVLPEEQSAFPPEILRRDPVTVLVDAGQKRLALSRAVRAPKPLSQEVLIVLAFAAKRRLNSAALSFSTGLSAEKCAHIIDNCVGWGLLTPTRRVTHAGLAELTAARRLLDRALGVAERGEDDYYPQSLRSRTSG